MTKRSITSNEFKKLTALLKLSITQIEMDKYSWKHSYILDCVAQLENVNTYDVARLLKVLDQAIDSKLDEPKPSIIQKVVLKNRSKINGDFFKYQR